jgi:hypothetical protein
MNAKSTSSRTSGVQSSTDTSCDLNLNFLPTDRVEAHSLISSMGKFRCSAMSKNTWPTAPVAPTTAILQEFKVSSVNLNVKPVDESKKMESIIAP